MAVGDVLQRARRRAEARPTASGRRGSRQRAIAGLRRLRRRAAERRGRARRDLSGHGQQRDDVRRARLCARPSAPRDRARVGREAARDRRTTRPIASPASRRSGTPRSPPTRCWRPAARRPRRRRCAALDWLKPLQVLDVKGDWAEARPDVRPGGWAFQYGNAHYPDLDDTAVVVMAMDRARGRRWATATTRRSTAASNGSRACRARTAAGARSTPTTRYYYLNNIPFADHGALLDPPTVDVTARVVSMLAQLGEPLDSPRMKAALAYLEREQDAGRQLVRPLGRQLHLRHLVGAVRAERGGRRPATPDDAHGRATGWSRSRTPTAAGARTATATSSTTRATSRRPPPPRRPPGRCSG